MRTAVTQLFVAFLVFFAFSGTAWAGPVGDAMREAAEVVDELEEKVETVVEELVETVREVQAHLNAAVEYAGQENQQKAEAHAIAARYKLRKFAKATGLKMEPLSPEIVAKKAGKDAMFKKHLKKLPSGRVLLTGPCQLPKCKGK